MAHSLYLAEYLAGGDEDLPSQQRLNTALSSLGVSLEDLEKASLSPVAGWMAAA
jgi:hypothetical protein